MVTSVQPFVNFFGVLLLCVVCPVVQADWPGLLGPNRNGLASQDTAIPAKVASSLKMRWKIPAGQGYAGPAVRDDQCVLYERIGESDVVRLVRIDNGKEIWRRELPARYRGGIDADKGPRCVPSFLPELIVVYSAAGELTALNRNDGSVRWSRPLRKEYQAEDGYFGAGSSPLVVKDRVIINVGGKQGGIVCLSIDDGKQIWTATDADASYAAPIAIEIDSRSVAIVPTRLKTYAVDVENGTVLWEVPFGQRGPTVNAATPIVNDAGEIFFTASYGIGSLLVRPEIKSGQIVSKGQEIYSQYATPVAMGGQIFGSDGREDSPGTSFKCIDSRTGKLFWEEPEIPISHVIADGDGRMLLFGIDGRMWGIQGNDKRFESLWQSKLPAGKYRALPALSGDTLYARSTVGGASEWFALELK